MSPKPVDPTALGPASLPLPKAPEKKTVKMTFESEEAAKQFLKEREQTKQDIGKKSQIVMKNASGEAVAKATPKVTPPLVITSTVTSTQEATANLKAGTTTGLLALTEKIELPPAAIKKIDAKVLKEASAKMGSSQSPISSSDPGMRGAMGAAMGGTEFPLNPNMDRWTMMLMLLKLANQNRAINSEASTAQMQVKNASNHLNKDAEIANSAGRFVEAAFAQINVRLTALTEFSVIAQMQKGDELVFKVRKAMLTAELTSTQHELRDVRRENETIRPSGPTPAQRLAAATDGPSGPNHVAAQAAVDAENGLRADLAAALATGNPTTIARARDNLAGLVGTEAAWQAVVDGSTPGTPINTEAQGKVAELGARFRTNEGRLATLDARARRIQGELMALASTTNHASGPEGELDRATAEVGERSSGARMRSDAQSNEDNAIRNRERVAGVAARVDRRLGEIGARLNSTSCVEPERARLVAEQTRLQGADGHGGVKAALATELATCDAAVTAAHSALEPANNQILADNAILTGNTGLFSRLRDASTRGRMDDATVIADTRRLNATYQAYAMARDAVPPNPAEVARLRGEFEAARAVTEGHLAAASVAPDLLGPALVPSAPTPPATTLAAERTTLMAARAGSPAPSTERLAEINSRIAQIDNHQALATERAGLAPGSPRALAIDKHMRAEGYINAHISLVTAQGRVDVLAGATGGTGGAITVQRAEADRVQQRIATLEADRARLSAERDDPNTSATRRNAINGRLAEIDTQLGPNPSAAGGVDTTLRGQLTTANARLASMRADLAAAQRDRQTFEALQAASLGTPGAAHAPTQPQIDAANDAGAAVTASSGALTTAHGNVANLEAQLTATNTALASAEVAVPRSETQITALRQRQTALMTDLATARTTLGTAAASYNAAQGRLGDAMIAVTAASWADGPLAGPNGTAVTHDQAIADYNAAQASMRAANQAFFAAPPLLDGNGVAIYDATGVAPAPDALASAYAGGVSGHPSPIPENFSPPASATGPVSDDQRKFDLVADCDRAWAALPAATRAATPRGAVLAAPPAPVPAEVQAYIDARAAAASVATPPTVAGFLAARYPNGAPTPVTAVYERAAAFTPALDTALAAHGDVRVYTLGHAVDVAYNNLPLAGRPTPLGTPLTPPPPAGSAGAAYNDAINAATAAGIPAPPSAAAARTQLYGTPGTSTLTGDARARMNASMGAQLASEAAERTVKRTNLVWGEGVSVANASAYFDAVAADNAALARLPADWDGSIPPASSTAARDILINNYLTAHRALMVADTTAHVSAHPPTPPATAPSSSTPATAAAITTYDGAITAARAASARLVKANAALATAQATLTAARAVAPPVAADVARAEAAVATAQAEVTAATTNQATALTGVQTAEAGITTAIGDHPNVPHPQPASPAPPGVTFTGFWRKAGYYTRWLVEHGLPFAVIGLQGSTTIFQAISDRSKFILHGLESIRAQSFARCDEVIEEINAEVSRMGLRDSADWQKKLAVMKDLVDSFARTGK